MARTGGDLTRKKILTTAEKLFSEKGYDGTSIQSIANAAQVNKALIYYHFKNKQDVIDSLFAQTLDEMINMQQHGNHVPSDSDVEGMVEGIIGYLQKKRKILTVMLMEALKNDKSGYISLFQCADMFISRNINQLMHKKSGKQETEISRNELLLHEFFTGFVPIVFFALFKDKWADFFKCDRKEMTSLFSKVFKKSHIQHG